MMQFIKHVDPVTGDSVSSALIHIPARGYPEKAEIRGFGGKAGMAVPSDDCFDGAGLSIPLEENALVFTFRDLSLLFANGTGEIC